MRGMTVTGSTVVSVSKQGKVFQMFISRANAGLLFTSGPLKARCRYASRPAHVSVSWRRHAKDARKWRPPQISTSMSSGRHFLPQERHERRKYGTATLRLTEVRETLKSSVLLSATYRKKRWVRQNGWRLVSKSWNSEGANGTRTHYVKKQPKSKIVTC